MGISIINAQEQIKEDTIARTKEIQEVLIKAQHKKQFADHSNYTFDKEALEKARHSKDLLTTLPELQLDPIFNTVASIKGGKTLFLINGIEASDNQIKSIAPTNVVRVEYFDIPPARYSQRADTVVNIITRNPEIGYSYGADITSALTTGFVNGSAYAGYTKGKNDFGLEYSINFRDYNDRAVKSNYDYQLNSSHYRTEEVRKDHFGYTGQNITLRYAHVVPNDFVLQAKLNTEITTSFVNGIGSSIFYKDISLDEHKVLKNSNSDYVIPTLDLYFSKKVGKKDELSVNFVGSHFTTNSTEFAKEWEIVSGNSIYDNDMILKAKQTGLVGELAHVHTFEKGNLSSGYRISNTSISNDLHNLSGFSQYNVNYLEQYIYTEYSGKKDKFSYRFGLGLTNIHNKTYKSTYDKWIFTPKIILGYQLKDNQMIRFASSYKPQSPGSAALSSNIVQWAPNIVQKGNPFLKSSQIWSNNLIYSFSNKYFDFNTNLYYQLTERAINQYFVLDNETGGYALTYENAKNLQLYGIQLSGSYKPFANRLLVLRAVITPSSERIETNNGTVIKNNYLNNYFVISSEYKNFSVQYQFNIPVYTLSGVFLSTNENMNHVFVNYRLKEWTFTSGMYWLGMPSEYKTKSLLESLVNYSRNTQIWNNKSMFIVGVSYDFSSGKKLQIQKKLNNSTATAATF
ncbi:TonB-dependent receptor [Elizabethkingia sp. JS20170427COW]|nr:TonB-dependent receptor [Elizabethkingia sp. JS20170427COW]